MKIQIVLLACLVALVVGKPASPCSKSDDGAFVKDDEECGIFYECSGGKAIKLSCPDTTYWNQKTSMCELDVNCGDLKTTTPRVPTDATTKAPDAPTKAPDAPTKAPDAPTKAPDAPTKAPDAPTEAPATKDA